jgi:hypothetical protein
MNGRVQNRANAKEIQEILRIDKEVKSRNELMRKVLESVIRTST